MKLWLTGKKKLITMTFMVFAMLSTMATSAFAAPPSQAIDFGSGGFTFSLGDIMTSSWDFIAGFNTYVILILALILVPTLVGFVIWLMSKVPKFRKSA